MLRDVTRDIAQRIYGGPFMEKATSDFVYLIHQLVLFICPIAKA